MFKRCYKNIVHYVLESGKRPYRQWLLKLSDVDGARIEQRINRLQFGHYGDAKRLSDCLFELRFTFGGGLRVYCAELDDHTIVLLCGGNKASQKKDIKMVENYLIDFIGRIDETVH